MTKVKTGVVYAFAANVNAHLRCVSLALLFLAEVFLMSFLFVQYWLSVSQYSVTSNMYNDDIVF